jgi:two-component system, OmpR family, response regulator
MGLALVIDADQALRAVVASRLADLGYGVAEAGDARTARSILNEPADLVVVDIDLPDAQGFDVVREIRRRTDAPMIVITARSAEIDRIAGLDLGADDYLVKPFSFVVLVARLRALLRRGAPERPTRLVAGDLEVDPATRRCVRGDTPVPLTSREFAVLEYLMRSPDRVISKTELIEHVWDEYYDGDPNIVEVYVGYLRRKVDAPFGRAAIETVRGGGYRLRPDGG